MTGVVVGMDGAAFEDVKADRLGERFQQRGRASHPLGHGGPA